MKILILGGDTRMVTASNELKRNGFDVETLGLFENDGADIAFADVLLLPVPTTRDGENVFCPLTNLKLPLQTVKKARKDALILSCGYSFEGMNCIDYLSLDEFCLANAVPTAEGAIAAAINDTPFTLDSSHVLVIGNGRVGKVLSSKLKALNCDITIAARKAADFAYINAFGMKYIHTLNVPQRAAEFDIIFNTIDITVFTSPYKELENCYLYDLSTKGCIDFESAQKTGIKAVKLPGLPGKTASNTAGKIIAHTVMQLIR